MNRRMRKALGGLAVYVGCRACGAVHKPLRRAGDGELYCPACMPADVPESGTGKNDGPPRSVAPTGKETEE